mgnify:CR=1 FL=1
MSKKQQWKKAIRAQVAATLQSNSAAPVAPVSGKANLPGQTPVPALVSPKRGVLTEGYHQDLVRIIWVAGILLILLVTAYITDQRSGWLDRLATQVSEAWSGLAAKPVPPETAGETAPAEAPATQAAPPAAEGGA